MAVEISPAGTRHSVKLSGTPAVSRAPGSVPLMVTVAFGSGASTLTPSSSGSLTIAAMIANHERRHSLLRLRGRVWFGRLKGAQHRPDAIVRGVRRGRQEDDDGECSERGAGDGGSQFGSEPDGRPLLQHRRRVAARHLLTQHSGDCVGEGVGWWICQAVVALDASQMPERFVEPAWRGQNLAIFFRRRRGACPFAYSRWSVVRWIIRIRLRLTHAKSPLSSRGLLDQRASYALRTQGFIKAGSSARAANLDQPARFL